MYDHKKRLILKTALRLFRLYGLRAVTMDDIAKDAGMSKKTLYTWFNDKNAMVDALYRSIISIVDHHLNKIQAEEKNVVIRYVRIIDLALSAGDFVTDKVMQELKKYNPTTWKKLQYFTEKKLVTAIAGCIEEGSTQQYFQPIFNSNVLAMLCLSELDFLNEAQQKNIPALSTAETRQQLTRHLLNGIATPAGKKQAEKYFSITQL